MNRTPRERFEHLYEHELDYVLTTLRRLGVVAKDVPDVGHEVFVRAFRLMGHFDDRRPARPWLYTLCYFASQEYKRNVDATAPAHRSRAPLEEQEQKVHDLQDERQTPESKAIQQSNREVLFQALDALSDEQRQVIVLYELEQRPMAEIAAQLQVPLHTAYSRLKAGRRALESALKALVQASEVL